MKRRRQGFAMGLVMVLAIVAGGMLVALSPLERTVARDLDSAQLEQETLALAHSAADELALRFAQAANRPGHAVYDRLRALDGLLGVPKAGRWTGGANLANDVGELTATEALRQRVGGGAHELAVRKTEISIDVEAIRGGVEPVQVTARVQFAATVRGSRSGRRALERRVVRVQGLKLTRLGMPWPFDKIGLFVQDGKSVLKRAPEQAGQIAEIVKDLHEQLEGHAKGFSSEQLAPLQAHTSRLAKLAATYAGPDHGLPYTNSSFILPVSKSDGRSLAPFLLDKQTDEASTNFHQRYADLKAAMDRIAKQQDLSQLAEIPKLFDAMLEAGERFHRIANDAVGQWIHVARDSAEHASWYGAGIATLATPLWNESRWFEVASLDAWLELIGETSARNGIVKISGNVKEISGAKLFEKVKGGRVVLLVPGDVKVSDLRAVSDGGLVTVIAEGKVTVSGTVEASIVAKKGIRFEERAKVTGSVFVEKGDVELAPESGVVRDERTVRGELDAPVAATYHVAMDPVLSTKEVL